jgi:sphingomyelin phosphodiesterase
LLQPTIKYIDSTDVVNVGNVCGMLLQDQNCQFSDVQQLEWTINLNAETKPPVNQPSQPPV